MYGVQYAWNLVIFTMVVTFSLTTPVIVPFGEHAHSNYCQFIVTIMRCCTYTVWGQSVCIGVDERNCYQYFNVDRCESVRSCVRHGFDVTSATCTLGTRLQ